MFLTIAYCIVTAAAVAYAAIEARMIFGYLAKRRETRAVRATRASEPERLAPRVVVQLPIFNEGVVALDLVRAVCDLDYPRERLDIQVLDDSTDATPQLIASEIARLAAEGHPIIHVRRPLREGWKAGALAHGLTLSEGEFIAIFDADFVPPPDYLRRVLIDGEVFDDPSVAFLQGRWTYTNEYENVLTRAQAILLNRHFVVQKPYQRANGRTTVFNGSAGVWRRAAIEAVGGWSADTLCEDLDLSYRCALAGWIGVYEETLVCPSEIPSSMTAFKLQQRRWAKGSAQCMRKLTSDILRSDRLAHRLEDLYAVTGYIVHPLLLTWAVLWPWVVLNDIPTGILWAGQIGLTFANLVAITGFVITTSDSERGVDWRSLRDIGFALLLGVSLMVNNTIAFVLGFFERLSVFERTPKHGLDIPSAPAKRQTLHWGIQFEFLFAAYAFFQAGVLVRADHAMEAMPCVMFGLCMVFMITFQLFERFFPGRIEDSATVDDPAFG